MKRKSPPKWLQAAKAGNGDASGNWLSRALSRAGVMPLTQAEDAIRHGRVRLDSKVMVEPMAPVTAKSRVDIDGKPVSLEWKTRVVMMHKPAGVVTHGTDKQGIGTVFEVLNAALPQDLHRFGWHAVGRLDRDTTGLLLFTNDERFVGHATSPETKLPKCYVANVGAGVTEQKIAPLLTGVMIDDGEMTRPAKAKVRDASTVELTLTEGRFHQVKRMLNAVGLPTLSLHREAVGGLKIDIPEREVRQLSDDEVRDLLLFEPRAG